jgi:hypothetical protein
MAKFREVPKNLVSFNSDELSEDTELIPPEVLFDDFGYENLFATTLASPETLFGKSTVKKIKLKSPEELFGKLVKPGNNGNGKDHKHLNIKKDKKSGK